MKILVTGAKGQLGYDVIKRLEAGYFEYLGTDRTNLDLANEDQVKSTIKNYMPDAVIHCAAYTAVDRAEDEKEICYQTNVLGTRYVAQACREIDAKMIYISTDYVFDGQGDQAFEVNHIPSPINHYGKTKYEGELEVRKLLEKYFIVRISWVFGRNGNNFVKTMLNLAESRREISVVSDQIGSPTYTYDLAKLLLEMIQTDKYGNYHASNEGYTSWYEFACKIFQKAGIKTKVIPIMTEDYPTKAKRPKNSRLSKKQLDVQGFDKLPNWQDALTDFLESLKR